MKTIVLKLTFGSRRVGPFTIYLPSGNILDSDIPKEELIVGKTYIIEDNVLTVRVASTGVCKISKIINIDTEIPRLDFLAVKYDEINTPAVFKHLTNISKYNEYYGEVNPYVVEHTFSAQYNDEILQNVKEYSKVYKYVPDGTGVFNNYEKIEVDNIWFNKAIVYNNQQNSGILELVKKPKNNLQQYNLYPIYRDTSKIITYTKSDNFYNFNTFWDILKNKEVQQFITDCNSLSIDKQLNQTNIDYTNRSFRKSPIRAKETRLRMILDSTSNYRITSHLNIITTQQSYK